MRNKLIDPRTDEKLERFIWYGDMKEWRVYGLMTVRCTHGHRDINDYVVKQCFLSEVRNVILALFMLSNFRSECVDQNASVAEG